MNYYVKSKKEGGKIARFESIDEIKEYVSLGKLDANDLIIEDRGRIYSELLMSEEWAPIKIFLMSPNAHKEYITSLKAKEDFAEAANRSKIDEVDDRFRTLSGYGIFLSVFGWAILVIGCIASLIAISKLGAFQAVILCILSVSIGIAFVVTGEMASCFVAIEKNGRITNNLLKNSHNVSISNIKSL